MFRKIHLIAIVLVLCLWLTSCVVVDAARLMYGNELATHSWLEEEKHSTIPFEYLNEHTIVKASINGVDNLRMVLDTGAAATVLFETEKTKPLMSDLDTKFSVGGIGKGDSTDAYFRHNTDLTLGSVTISGLTAVFIKAADNPMFATPDVTYMDGVIGYDLFSRFVTEINFTEQTVRISENVPLPLEGYGSLPLTIKNKLPWLDISILSGQESATLPVMFDTGGIGSLLINDSYGIPTGEVLYHTQASGLGGESPVTANRLEKVVVGEYGLPNIIAGVSEEASSKTNIMGTGLINRFNLIVDYSAAQVHIKPNGNFNKPDYVNVLGAGFMPHTKGAFINSIQPDSMAETLGLKEADVIITVNNMQIHHENYDVSEEQLVKLSAVKDICYLRNGEQHCKAVHHN